MSKVLMIKPEKCTSCRTCELICSFNRDKEFNPKHSCVAVLGFEEAAISVPVMCMQCEEASCMKACPVNAISKVGDAMQVDENKCIVCKMCLSACPLGNMGYNPITKKVLKCDLCGGDPMCAKLCPSGAIAYEDAEPDLMAKKKDLAKKLCEVFGEVQ